MPSSRSTPTLLDTLVDVPRVSAAAWRRLGWLRRGLLISRAAVLPLTLLCCLFGGLLALPWTPAEGGRLVLSTLALLLAHAASNLLNDQIDWRLGVDRDSYPRLRYGVHPLAQGLMRPATHTALTLVVGALAVGLGLVVCRMAGGPAYGLALAGGTLLVFYTWPLKRLGLGEIAVWLVWGPLMSGGVYWVVSGDWGPEIAVLTGIFGLGPTVVVFAKHADKRRDDAARGIRTLPVRLGPVWGPRCTALLAIALVAGGLAWAMVTGAWTYLLLLASLPALGALVRVCLRPRPGTRPQGFPTNLWPLWYTAAAFRFARSAGLALVTAALLAGLPVEGLWWTAPR
jgi:1,4-dihydroxy-2-naphthoate polyprenyltransferase